MLYLLTRNHDEVAPCKGLGRKQSRRSCALLPLPQESTWVICFYSAEVLKGEVCTLFHKSAAQKSVKVVFAPTNKHSHLGEWQLSLLLPLGLWLPMRMIFPELECNHEHRLRYKPLRDRAWETPSHTVSFQFLLTCSVLPAEFPQRLTRTSNPQVEGRCLLCSVDSDVDSKMLWSHR